MPYNPRLRGTIPLRVSVPVARPARGELTNIVSEHTAAPRFIKGNPVFHLRTEGVEDDTGVVGVIGDEFFLVQ